MRLIKFILFSSILLLWNCQGNSSDVDAKKAELQKLKKEAQGLNNKIAQLEKEIAQADPNFMKSKVDATLITIAPAKIEDFTSYIEVQGTVESDKNVILTAETAGVVRALSVDDGQVVGAGQVIVQQDADVLLKNIESIKTSLTLAQDIYQRQENLWKQKIGTEVQYLQAKTNKESLEKQLQTTQAQLAMATVTAPFAGIVDEVLVKQGQMAMPGTPLVRLVSLSQVQVKAEVAENYLSKIKLGDVVQLEFPSLNITKEAKVTNVGQIINPANRTFKIEIKLANADQALKPDLLALVRIKDFVTPNAVVIPNNLIQKDKISEFVFIVDTTKHEAKQIRITTSKKYNNHAVVTSGLKGDEKLIKEGFREVVDGSKIKITQ